MEEYVIAWISVGLTTIGAVTVSTVYLITQINKKLSFGEYDDKHEKLSERVRKLELWASKKSFGGDID